MLTLLTFFLAEWLCAYDTLPFLLNCLPMRRSLSDADIKGKRRGSLFQNSMGELSLEQHRSADSLMSGLGGKLKYCDFVTVAGVSDIPALVTENEQEPVGISFTRLADLKNRRSNLRVVVSLLPPHKLLVVTQELCAFFGYLDARESEICGRPLHTLFGPRTDQATIESGIQHTAHLVASQHTVVLYNRDGQDVEVAATFSPYLSDRDTLAGCLLELAPQPELPRR